MQRRAFNRSASIGMISKSAENFRRSRSSAACGFCAADSEPLPLTSPQSLVLATCQRGNERRVRRWDRRVGCVAWGRFRCTWLVGFLLYISSFMFNFPFSFQFGIQIFMGAPHGSFAFMFSHGATGRLAALLQQRNRGSRNGLSSIHVSKFVRREPAQPPAMVR